MSFSSSEDMQFTLLGRRMDKILGMDCKGRGILYEDDTHAVRPMPGMTAPERYRPLSVAVDGVGPEGEGSLYVIEAEPTRDLPSQPQSVEALVYEGRHSCNQKDDWVWRSLPPPPYVHELPGLGTDERSGEIICHGMEGNRVVNGSLVWVSTAGRGTYWLDTGSGMWSKASDWALPFRGRASPVWEYGLWFGFSAVDSGHICATNLYLAAEDGRPPVAEQVWEGFAVPEGCREMGSYLMYLGNFRFCVAKLFRMTTRRQGGGCCWDVPKEECFATLTGVEVVRGDHACKWHQMMKHRSLQYLGEYFSGCVLWCLFARH
ncbi:hypothetical protein VPH35_103624 [Triticum aestivum]